MIQYPLLDILSHTHKKTEIRISKRCIHSHVYYSIVYNDQEVETS